MSAVDDYLRALERERAADPQAFAMKAKMMAPAAFGIAGAGYTGPRTAKPAAPAVPPAVAARNRTVASPSFAQVPAGQVAPARYTPPAPVTSPFGITYDGPMTPPSRSPILADKATLEDLAGYDWGNLGQIGTQAQGMINKGQYRPPPRGSNMALQQLADYDWGELGQIGTQAQAMLDAPSASVGPGNMEGMRAISTAAQSIQDSGESPEKIAANLKALSGLSLDEIDYFNAAVDSGFFDGVAAGGGMPPAGGMDPMGGMGGGAPPPPTGDMGGGGLPLDMGGGGLPPPPPPADGRVPTPTTGFTDTQKTIVNNALQDRLDVITTMVSEGLLDVASAQGVWEAERNKIFANFLSEQQEVKRIYDAQQAQRQGQAAQLRTDLFADVDQSLAAEDFAMANAILQGAGAENQDYLAAIGRIGGMSDDALRMMGGTVERDIDNNLILDEAGRPQFGGGIFGNYAQDLLSQERDMGAGAQFDAIDQLQLADETALQGLQLAEFLGVDPQTFAAGQYAGVDVGNLQAGRDASAAAIAEADLDRQLRRELAADQDLLTRDMSAADIASREGMSAADILSREGIASDKDQLSRDLAADDLALAMQKLAQDSGQFRSQQLEDKLANTQRMNLATEELALDQAQMEADMLFDAAMLAREDGGGDNPLTNALMTGLAGQLSDVAYQGALSDITEALMMEGETSLDDRSLGNIIDTLDPKYQELVTSLMQEQLGYMGMSLDNTTAIADAQEAGAIVGEMPEEEVSTFKLVNTEFGPETELVALAEGEVPANAATGSTYYDDDNTVAYYMNDGRPIYRDTDGRDYYARPGVDNGQWVTRKIYLDELKGPLRPIRQED